MPRGWHVIAKEPYQARDGTRYYDKGCCGFDTKSDAEKWLADRLDDGYISANAITSIVFEKGG